MALERPTNSASQSENKKRKQLGNQPARESAERGVGVPNSVSGQERISPLTVYKGKEKTLRDHSKVMNGSTESLTVPEVPAGPSFSERHAVFEREKARLESKEYTAFAFKIITEEEKKIEEEKKTGSLDYLYYKKRDEREMLELDARIKKIAELPSRLKDLKDEEGCTPIYGVERDSEGNTTARQFVGLIMRTSEDPEKHEDVVVFTSGHAIVISPDPENPDKISQYKYGFRNPKQVGAFVQESENLGVDADGIVRPDFVKEWISKREKNNGVYVVRNNSELLERGEVMRATEKALDTITVRKFKQEADAGLSELLYQDEFNEIKDTNKDADISIVEEKQKEAESAIEDPIFEKLGENTQKLMEMQSSIEALNLEGFGARLRLNNNFNSVFGLGLKIPGSETPKALIVSKSGLHVVTPPTLSEWDHKYFDKSILDRASGYIPVNVEEGQRNDPDKTSQALIQALRNYGAVVELTSDNPEHVGKIAEYVDAVQLAITEERVRRFNAEMETLDNPPAQAA